MMPSTAPHMVFFPVAGRGELTRLIAIAGGVTLTESSSLECGQLKSDYTSPRGLPLLEHGELKMSQSTAVESYIASIAPKFAKLSPQQRAIDAMYGSIKEEILGGCVQVLH